MNKSNFVITSGIFSKSELYYMLYAWSLKNNRKFSVLDVHFLLELSQYKLFKEFVFYVYSGFTPSFLRVSKDFPEITLNNSHFAFLYDSTTTNK